MSGATCDGVGWVYFNEDAGEEYAPNHPVKSGEVPDATRIRRSTTQEDVLWSAFQAEFQRAHALETATPSQRLDAATVERLPDREEIARVLFDQRQTQHDFDDAEDADPESDAGTLRSICFDDADAVLALATEPHGGKRA